MTSPILWATLDGVPVGDGGPILTVAAADVVTSEIDRATPHSFTLAAADERTILSMKPFTLIEIEQPGQGTIGHGYVLNPRQQLQAGDVAESGQSTIVLQLVPVALFELSRRHTHRGWVSNQYMNAVFNMLVTSTPGWSAIFSDYGKFDEQGYDLNPIVNVKFNDITFWNAILTYAKQFERHIRTAPIIGNNPSRVLEMGTFKDGPFIWLTASNGADPDGLELNDLIRVPASIDYQPDDVSNLVNVCTPFGGGADDASIVTLDRLWGILNDPSYVNYGRFGTDAESMARVGKDSVFKEYDNAYPISDPENPPTGQPQWQYFQQDGTPIDPNPGYTTRIEPRDGAGITAFTTLLGGVVQPTIVSVLVHGAYGTRFFTRDGHIDYMVYDKASFTQYGYHEGPLRNSNITPTDEAVANQELIQIGLYLSAIANFKRNAHPHHLFSCEVPALHSPPRAGDLIAVDIQHSHINDEGAVIELDVTENFQVMQVIRHFPAMTDTYLLSNLGRFDQDDASLNAEMQNQIIAFQIRQDTSVAPYPLSVTGNCDALHPLTIKVPIPSQLHRWRGFSIQCDFLPFSQTSETALNQAVDFTIFTKPQDILLDTPSDINLSGDFTTDGATLNGQNAGFDLVQTGVDNDAVVQMIVTNDGTLVPDGQDLKGQLVVEGGSPRWRLWSSGIPNGQAVGSSMRIKFTKDKTKSATAATLAKSIIKKFGTVARIAGTTIIATLPPHWHPLDKKIAINGPIASTCSFTIDGVSLPSAARLMDGTRNGDGTFAGSFRIGDIGDYMEKPGQTIELKLTPNTDANNPYGAAAFQITMLGFGEFGLLGAANVQLQ